MNGSWRSLSGYAGAAVVAVMAAALLSHAVVAADESAVKPPEAGQPARPLELNSWNGQPVTLTGLRRTGPVVLVVLRGYPGYQCPLCTRQVSQFLSSARKFAEAKTSVLFVYPGPEAALSTHAEEFLKNQSLPRGFQLVIDPDYEFTRTWGLRWNQPGETAYPSTFVIDRDGRIRFAKISRTHGDRADVQAVLTAVHELQDAN